MTSRDVLERMASDLTDEELIAAIQQKDVHALEAFYDRHRVLAYSLAVRMLGNSGDAEDVVQEAFLNVWRSSGTYRAGRGGGRSWLLSVVHHRAIDKLRGRQSRPQGLSLDEGLAVPDRTDVWRDVAGRLDAQAVKQALDTLPPEQRQTIELAYFKGNTQAEIAELMQVPLGTVKGRVRLALHHLKDLLAGHQAELEIE